ncbi:type 2 periplasmic-binding domain-containing protein [Paenibacillus xylanivorans]|uniref:Uncharacterized protein n=1 Tax=Paenibacillus xylanivorans TaxID=1705561 RepID=A0A0N0C3D5_9BACL|nr:hypothetical protein [Paenibacillus xylanivorans]KOY14201.1 hypothetical protein AMS66_22665 [Paenibacillus xylanivorans]
MFKTKLVATSLALAIGVVGVGGSLVSGMGFFNFSSYTNNFTLTVSASFTPSVVTTSSHGFGLTPGKNVKQAYVWLKEGNYDSGRVYSPTAKNTSDSNLYEAVTSKVNNPFSTATSGYGWIYF